MLFLKRILLKIINSCPHLQQKVLQYKLRKGDLIELDKVNYNGASEVLLGGDPNDFKVGLVADGLIESKYVTPRSYLPFFVRFFKNNSIQYSYLDIHASDWIEQSKKYDLIIWRTDSALCKQEESNKKIYILNDLGIKTFPRYQDALRYEDKVLMHDFYKSNNLNEIPTFVSYSKQEALAYVQSAQYPIVAKIATGSSSNGVEIIKKRSRAKQYVLKAFSDRGLYTYWPYYRQKGYVYFQKFINDATYDLRIMVIGDELFGYYRYPKKGDFRASGSGLVTKKEIPTEAMDLAWEVKQKFGSSALATDFVYSEAKKKFYIIESSIFIGIDTERQLEINGVAGKYVRIDKGNYKFVEGKWWIQELMLKEYFRNDIN